MIPFSDRSAAQYPHVPSGYPGYLPVYETDAGGTVRECLSAARRRWYLLLIPAVVGASLGLMHSLQSPRLFRSVATIEVQSRNPDFLNTREADPTAMAYSEEFVPTQMRMLQSFAVVDRAIRRISDTGERPRPPRVELTAHERAVSVAAGLVSVRQIPRTRILEVVSSSTDPRVAADFANALAEEYMTYALETRWEASRRTSEWMKQQVGELKTKLAASEQEFQGYTAQLGTVFSNERESVQEDRLRQLQQQLSQAQGELMLQQSRYEIAMSAPPEALPDLYQNSTLRDYEMRLTDLRRQAAELNVTLTPQHPKVKRVEAQIAELQPLWERERTNMLARIANQYKELKTRVGLLGHEYQKQSGVVAQQASASVRYNVLRREVETNRQLYDAMLKKVSEANIAAAIPASIARVIDRARPSRVPFSPNPKRDVLFGGSAGLLLGGGLVFLGRKDRRLRRPGESHFTLDLAELGVIPSAYRIEPLYRRISNRASGLLGAAEADPQEPLERIAATQKQSVVAESFWSVVTSIVYANPGGKRPRVIVITSASPGEGKTTVASNCAIALAIMQESCLLIDADLRNPRLHKVFDLPNERGFADLLAEGSAERPDLLSASLRTGVDGLQTLPSGPVRANTPSLLHSPALKNILRGFRAEFHNIVIDAPPASVMADARILGRLADAVILVVRSGKTSRDAALAAKKRLEEDGSTVLGIVLNDWDPAGDRDGTAALYRSYYQKS